MLDYCVITISSKVRYGFFLYFASIRSNPQEVITSTNRYNTNGVGGWNLLRQVQGKLIFHTILPPPDEAEYWLPEERYSLVVVTQISSLLTH